MTALLVASAFALEAAALRLVLVGPVAPSSAALAMAALAHGASSVAVGLATRALLPRRWAEPAWRGALLPAALALFVPLVGAVGLVCALAVALAWPRRAESTSWWRVTPVPELSSRPLRARAAAPCGGGWLVGLLKHAADPEHRLRAVTATQKMADRLAIPILTLALRDPVDDVRLLAYALLDAKERAIYARIQRQLEVRSALAAATADDGAPVTPVDTAPPAAATAAAIAREHTTVSATDDELVAADTTLAAAATVAARGGASAARGGANANAALARGGANADASLARDGVCADASLARAAARADVERRLAQEHWELAYLGLVEGDVLAHVLEAARCHAEAALALAPRDAGLEQLLARVLLRQGDAAGCEAALDRAVASGLPREATLPLLAEVRFRQRRYVDVRDCLAGLDPAAAARAPLDAVAAYWLGADRRPPPSQE